MCFGTNLDNYENSSYYLSIIMVKSQYMWLAIVLKCKYQVYFTFRNYAQRFEVYRSICHNFWPSEKLNVRIAVSWLRFSFIIIIVMSVFLEFKRARRILSNPFRLDDRKLEWCAWSKFNRGDLDKSKFKLDSSICADRERQQDSRSRVYRDFADRRWHSALFFNNGHRTSPCWHQSRKWKWLKWQKTRYLFKLQMRQQLRSSRIAG